MKVEIDIADADIRAAIEKRVRAAIADQANDWSAGDYIRAQVKAKWKSSADAVILEIMGDHAALRARIMAEMEKKIKAQLNAAMKAAGV